ncbi:MAG TPA: aquaporin [Candidatus Limnocylindria bacterium]|jgi:MIP family channel proteins
MSGTVPALVAEAIGTFLFFFIAAGAALVVTGDPAAATIVVALAHGVVLAVLVSSFGAVSGGHFNPAVTLGLWVAGKIDVVKGLTYMVVQLFGAAAAGFGLAWVLGDVSGAVPALGDGVDVTEGIVLEAIMTTVLLFAVFGTAVDPRGPKIGGLAIGLAVAVDILFGGSLTGAAMNPARWFGLAVAAGDYANWYVWWIGPFLGAIVVALLYRFLLKEPEEASAA